LLNEFEKTANRRRKAEENLGGRKEKAERGM